MACYHRYRSSKSTVILLFDKSENDGYFGRHWCPSLALVEKLQPTKLSETNSVMPEDIASFRFVHSVDAETTE